MSVVTVVYWWCVVVQVLMRQRELGLAQIAGTSDMPIDGQPPLANSGFAPGTPAAPR